MKILFLISALLLGLAVAVPRITIKGQRMYDDTGKQFFCRGVAYAPNPTSLTADPLGNLTAIRRDIPILKSLNVNCIRIYQFFAFSKVETAMNLLNDAGIYVILDLYDPNDNINRDQPEWSTYLFQIFQAKIDLVAPYPNLLGILAGNEVTNTIATTPAAAYVKAAIRDIKAYIKKKYTYKIPIGFSTADAGDLRDNLQNYNACGGDDVSVDFYGVNIYRWCSNNNNPQDTYQAVVNDYSRYPVPTILTEFGCILAGKTRFVRQFTDVPYIFGNPMNTEFSGAIAYEYHTSASALRPEGSYGIVDFSQGESVATLNQEGRNLRDQYAKIVNITGTQSMAEYVPNPKTIACPTKSSSWLVNSTVLPPVADVDRCICLNNQFQCRTKVQNPADITINYAKQLTGVLDYICGNNQIFCANLLTDATAGTYGRYSMCAPLIRASLIMNYQYLNSSQCEFGQDANFQEFIQDTPEASGVCKNYGDSASLEAIGIQPTENTINPITDSDTNRASFNSVPSTVRDVPTSASGSSDNGGNTNPSSNQDGNGQTNTITSFTASASTVASFSVLIAGTFLALM
eukprot:TRINITY_DN159_c0_g1_i1.p1 TRINITY_DN159_c0_g1~~TRINITY_DN159_c0_g1_i1.p1  ORF type:complete len:573 (-),score=177.78 TRINITY_DN159_c0_g1_i1:168-1886(-)